MVESRVIQCKVCKETKTALKSIASSVKNSLWETDGKRWNGLVCHICHKANMKERQRIKRGLSA